VTIVELLKRQRSWGLSTFGPGPLTTMVIAHIRKELAEIEAKPLDLEEWVDVLILASTGAMRAGHDPETIVAAWAEKLRENIEDREWPDWRALPRDLPIEHVRARRKASAQ